MKIIDILRMQQVKAINNLDDTSKTLLHSKIIEKKPFLKKIYIDFYNEFKNLIGNDINNKIIVEIGSGGGFIKKIIPNAITSDILILPNLDIYFSATENPFKDNSIDVYLMLNVLHHIPNIKKFFIELDRTLKINGKAIMIEPANTIWSRFIYRNFHHEDFDIRGKWFIENRSPLSGANGALPWIIFFRDKEIFEKEFPSLQIHNIIIHTPFRYIISGGFTFKQLLPSFTYNIISKIEKNLSILINILECL
ncbi:MAG: methyltransferase domain-containing protein [Candidatus Woesearchaeota archaeon]